MGEAVPHVYMASSYNDVLCPAHGLPKRVDLNHSRRPDIDPFSPRLLKIYRAISEILHLSGAGEYIDRVLHDTEEPIVRSDGTTNIGAAVAWKLMELAGDNCLGWGVEVRPSLSFSDMGGQKTGRFQSSYDDVYQKIV